MPIAAVGDADGFAFLFVGDFVEVDGWGKNVDEEVTGDDGDKTGAFFRATDEGELDGVHGVDVAGDTSDAAFVGFNDADEMAVVILFVMTTMDHVHFFTLLQNHGGLCGRFRGKTQADCATEQA